LAAVKLARILGLGLANKGTRHWWQQRLTAVALVPLGLVFAVLVLRLAGAPREVLAATFAKPPAALVALLLLGAGYWHLKLGLNEVIEDYVHHEKLKAVGQLLVGAACAVLGLAGMLAVLRLAMLG
jgi:succinate dehydrogenase / fumarate reductase membrane anchor subunit